MKKADKNKNKNKKKTLSKIEENKNKNYNNKLLLTYIRSKVLIRFSLIETFLTM